MYYTMDSLTLYRVLAKKALNFFSEVSTMLENHAAVQNSLQVNIETPKPNVSYAGASEKQLAEILNQMQASSLKTQQTNGSRTPQTTGSRTPQKPGSKSPAPPNAQANNSAVDIAKIFGLLNKFNVDSKIGSVKSEPKAVQKPKRSRKLPLT